MASHKDGPPRRQRPQRDADPISAGLRRMWAEAEEEPVPDALLALIQKIDDGSADGGPERGQ